MKWLKRILIGLLVLILIVVVGGVGVFALEVTTGPQVTDFTNVSYPAADGTELHAYLTQPEGAGPFPAVLMVHEWWGLNGEITEMADMLAEEGYIVLAPDTYRGQTTSLMPRALYLRLNTPEAQIDSDVTTAFAYLAGLETVDTARIGLIGFCYGGGVVLRHAVANPQVAATINLYGDTILDPAGFGALLGSEAGPLLGIFGAEDAQIPVSEVEDFQTALAATAIDHTLTLYPGVGHAFVNPATIADGGAAAEAWVQITGFFAQTLQTESVTES